MESVVYQYRFDSIGTQLLFDETSSFVLEAELVVEINPEKKASEVDDADDFVSAMKSIFNDEKNSDVCCSDCRRPDI